MVKDPWEASTCYAAQRKKIPTRAGHHEVQLVQANPAEVWPQQLDQLSGRVKNLYFLPQDNWGSESWWALYIKHEGCEDLSLAGTFLRSQNSHRIPPRGS